MISGLGAFSPQDDINSISNANAINNDGHPVDINDDGFVDIDCHYRTVRTGITKGGEDACVSGALLDGTSYLGCDGIVTVPMWFL